MRRESLIRVAVVVLALATALPAAAQEFRGRITGVVKDASGAVLPGVTVTATSPALIQPQATTTGADGTYRLIALPAGTYEITFELAGFQTFKREGIRVVINTTLPLDVELKVATLQETVTVTGASPVVDASTTTVGTNFTKELLTEIPNARDVWAAMAQAPGFQVTGYDVGGSHTGTQTGYITYGFSDQNTTRIEGVNTTEGTAANAGYFDFGSFEEMQLAGAGSGADQDVAGANINITVKSGGDRFSGNWYSDFENKKTISDNVPDNLRSAFTRDSDGFFARTALRRGNPIDRQYDLNGNVGGPIYRRKAWFFYSYRLNNQYKQVLNPDGTLFDTLAQSKLSNKYTFKGTYQLTKGNQIIGYINKREKLQALRDFGPGVPLSAAYFQSSRNYPFKIEWTSVLSDRLFLDVLGGNWWNYFPLRPTAESGAFDGPYVPGRQDINTSDLLSGGPNNAYQDQRRTKPQFAVSLSYFKDGWHGSHNLKFGAEGRHETRKFFQDQPFNLFYRDTVLNRTSSQVDFFNTPNDAINQTNNVSEYVQDTWKFSDKLTLNLGLRVDYYKDYWPEQQYKPEGVPQLAGTTDARLITLWTPRTIEGQVVSSATTAAPRAGFAYDVAGNGRSVVKAYWGMFFFNSAPDTIAASANPNGGTRLRYNFNDLNGNLVIDGPQELGTFVSTVSGPSGVTIDPNLKRPYSHEISTHFEQELRPGLSGRVSYVYKNIRREWEIVDLARRDQWTVQRTATDPGPDGVAGTTDDGAPFTVLDLSARGLPENRVFTNPTDPESKSDYNTLELAVNRRFSGKMMLLTSFEHTWLKQFMGTASSTSSTGAAGNTKSYAWEPNIRRYGRETTTLWNYKLIGRYVAPLQIGLSGSYKLQSGRQWGRTLTIPASVLTNFGGTQAVRVEPATANRAPNVHIVDIRFDKTFMATKRSGRIIGTIDVFNLLNAGTPITFRTTTANLRAADGSPFGNFKEVTALLDPRIVRFGFRYEF